MLQALANPTQRLGSKLAMIVTAFLLVALAAIGFTLLVSWELEGGAAAVNQAGSERMRAYHIALLLSQSVLPGADSARIRADIEREIASFEEAMRLLEVGDPARPMFLPRSARIQDQFAGLRALWQQRMKPQITGFSGTAGSTETTARLLEYRRTTGDFVDAVDELVLAIERDISGKTSLLRSLQLGLIWMSIIGTVALIYLMFLLVVRPVSRLEEGMRAVEAGEFDVRVPVETRDEFGTLAAGFNRMALNLQDLYRNLEAKVAEKTRSLERQNRELATLYQVAALLNRPGSIEDMCREFLRKLMATLGADGGAVRLVGGETGALHLYVQENLDEAFVRGEVCLAKGECLCGQAAQRRSSVVRLFAADREADADYRCSKAGYQSVSAFSIPFKNQNLGIFNLYFRGPRDLDLSERLMLESLGKHLGVAIESQRLVAREKEMAVSEERNLIAQELHDSIAQSLAFLNLEAQLVQKALGQQDLPEVQDGLGRMREGIQECYDDVRELLVHFRTRFGESDVETAIRTLLRRFRDDTGIDAELKPSGAGVPLSPETQIQVLHVIQECLSNARKHSGAKQVVVELERGREYRFRVRDDGRGFDPEKCVDGHVGLAIMRERARRIGGRITLESRPGNGTSVTLRLPLVQEAAA